MLRLVLVALAFPLLYFELDELVARKLVMEYLHREFVVEFAVVFEIEFSV